MISLTRPTHAGAVTGLFIGNDEEFKAPAFREQYDLILQKVPGITRLAYVEQVHGDRAIRVIAGAERLCSMGEGDALYTQEPNTALLIRTADCIPVLFYSTSRQLVGAVHAGWRGLAAKILTQTLEGFGKSDDLEFVVGPFIREQSYEVGDDVALKFEARFSERRENGKFLLNLGAVLKAEFAGLGISEKAIIWHDTDTLTSPDWYSARRGDHQRNLALIFFEKNL